MRRTLYGVEVHECRRRWVPAVVLLLAAAPGVAGLVWLVMEVIG